MDTWTGWRFSTCTPRPKLRCASWLIAADVSASADSGSDAQIGCSLGVSDATLYGSGKVCNQHAAVKGCCSGCDGDDGAGDHPPESPNGQCGDTNMVHRYSRGATSCCAVARFMLARLEERALVKRLGEAPVAHFVGRTYG
eukprot:6199522-Pleurochrysis_carterae.AAC.1